MKNEGWPASTSSNTASAACDRVIGAIGSPQTSTRCSMIPEFPTKTSRMGGVDALPHGESRPSSVHGAAGTQAVGPLHRDLLLGDDQSRQDRQLEPDQHQGRWHHQ